LEDYNKEIVDDKLTQADLIKLMLHNAQHMATREEVKADINKIETSLKADISKLDDKISKVETSLKADISKLDDKISKVDGKFDKIQWLIVATVLTVLLKDYIFSFLK